MRRTSLAFLGPAAALAALTTQVSGQETEWIDVPLADAIYSEQAKPMRQDTIDIPLPAFGRLEYKLGLEEGDAIVYRWTAIDLDEPDLLYAEFHGHTEPEPGEPGTVMFYRKAEGGDESGALTAPFSGIHGWYLENRSSAAIVVRLDVAGFYRLIEQ
jgi:hypothetical protein